MGRIMAIINQKGGVGKSTSALSIGVGLKIKKKRVLFIDIDAQGNLSDTMRADGKISSLDIMLGNSDIMDAIQQMPNGDIIPASPELSKADLVMTSTGREYRLKKALEPVKKDYDYIIIDTPPALGGLTVNALTAATEVLIPTQADFYSLGGITQLKETIETVREYCNPNLNVMGILVTRYSSRTVISRDLIDVIQNMAEQLGTKLYKTMIRDSVAIRESQAERKDIFSYAPKSNAALDYAALVKEILKEE